ncbi:hypothetical protein AB0420_02435 [Streptomyces caelestis]|uniref:hypothetical protein n=1 Tax=Streptomyces caelestis TaxID=36816 RepID=UPI0034502EEB
MTSQAARALGEDLAAAGGTAGAGTVSAQVIDVTDAGVNLDYRGALLIDVPCADSYRNRQPGDWVALRPGARPVVMWRLGADPGEADESTVRRVATEVALDEQVVRAATWGTGAPSGTGWQTVQQLYMRKNSEGKIELYAQVAEVTDDSPTPPPARAPKPVTLSPSWSGTWRSGRPDTYASYPTQGDWTGRGNRRGAWGWGTRIADACAGRTVASMTIRFTRRTGSGVNAKRPLHLYLHAHASEPSGQLDLGDGPEDLLSLSAGATGTATLPAAWRTALASGAARGLAIYANGSHDYMSVSGGSLTITFS